LKVYFQKRVRHEKPVPCASKECGFEALGHPSQDHQPQADNPEQALKVYFQKRVRHEKPLLCASKETGLSFRSSFTGSSAES